MKNQSSFPGAGHRNFRSYPTKLTQSLILKSFLLFLICLSVIRARLPAQNIVFNSMPVTTVPELGNYSYNLDMVAPDNKPITFSGQGFPSWLTIGASVGSPLTLTSSLNGNITGLAIDQDGNLYAAESSTTGKIYKIDKNGNTTVFANKISAGNTPSMIIVGNYLYASHSVGATGIVQYDLTQLNPMPVAVYSGYPTSDLTYHDGAIYATTTINQKIIRLDLSTYAATEFLTTPFGCLATEFDQNGDLLITEPTQRVQKYSFTTGTYSAVISGLAFSLYDLQWDREGNLCVLSAGSVRRYDPSLTTYTTMTTGAQNDLCFTSDGALVYGTTTGSVLKLAAKATVTGTPSHADVGSYPVKIIASNGTVSKEQEFIITVTDPNAPLLTANSPLDNAIDIPGTEPLVLTFNENVKPGAGNIEFRRWPDGWPLASINVNDAPNAVFNNSTVTINHFYLPNATEVYVFVPDGAILDMSDNPFAGFNNETLTFTTFNCSATLSAADGATTFCPGDNINLSASAGVTYEWRQNNILVEDGTSPTFTASQSGAYRVIVTDNQGCRDTSDVVQLNEINVDAMISGPAILPCEGEVTLSGAQGMESYEWYYNGQPAGVSTNTLKTNKAGTYTVTVTNEGCILTTATPFSLTIDVNGDCDSDGITNGAECPGGIDCPDKDNDGRADYLQNNKSQAIIMPKLFSPNGDGINDIITPITPGLKTFISLKVYNRWGNLVFDSRERDKGWDGKMQGKPQPNDSYVWICTGTDYNGRTFSSKGIFTLIR